MYRCIHAVFCFCVNGPLPQIRAHQPWVLAAQAVVMSAFAVYVCLKVSFGSVRQGSCCIAIVA